MYPFSSPIDETPFYVPPFPFPFMNVGKNSVALPFSLLQQRYEWSFRFFSGSTPRLVLQLMLTLKMQIFFPFLPFA